MKDTNTIKRDRWSEPHRFDLIHAGYKESEVPDNPKFSLAKSLYRKTVKANRSTLCITVAEIDDPTDSAHWKVYGNVSLDILWPELRVEFRKSTRALDIERFLLSLAEQLRSFASLSNKSLCKDCGGTGVDERPKENNLAAFSRNPCVACYSTGKNLINLNNEISSKDDCIVLKIEFVSINKATNPNLPSHFFSGSGDDTALFRVSEFSGIDRDAIVENTISEALFNWNSDCYLTAFDSDNLIGTARFIDSSAPSPGICITIKL